MAQGPGKYNSDDEISLSDLLPDLLDTKQPSKIASSPANQSAATPPPLPTWAQFVPTEPAAPVVTNTPPPPPAYSTEVPADFLLTPESLYPQPEKPAPKKKSSNAGINTGLILGLGAALLIVPTLIFGLFFVIANSQSEAKPLSGQELENALKTPLPSPGTPAPNSSPVSGTPGTPGAKAAPTPTLPPFELKNDCGYKAAAGRIDPFPCSKPLPTDKSELRPIIAAADKQLSDSGNKPLGNLRYDYAKDKPERVQEFYSGMLRTMGYKQEQDSPTGQSGLGSYRVLYYTNGARRIQVVVFNITAPIAGGVPAQGDIVIRVSAN